MPSKRVTIERILCPTDFSEFSERALRHAVRLGGWFGSPITVLHAIPPISSTMAGPMGGGYVSIPEQQLINEQRDAENAMRRFVAPHLGADVAIETKVIEGDPWRLIEAVAAALPAELVVMGTHGRSGWNRFILGSITEKVIRLLDCPVLTVGARETRTTGPLFHRILCAADLADASAQTAELALSLAQENLARLTLLHVMEGRTYESFSTPHPAPAEVASAMRRIREARLQRLERLVDSGSDTFCDVTRRVESGTPWREILKVADETAADLIVVGAHARGGLRAFLGSTADQVLRHASCPVLVTRSVAVKDSWHETRGAHAVARSAAVHEVARGHYGHTAAGSRK